MARAASDVSSQMAVVSTKLDTIIKSHEEMRGDIKEIKTQMNSATSTSAVHTEQLAKLETDVKDINTKAWGGILGAILALGGAILGYIFNR